MVVTSIKLKKKKKKLHKTEAIFLEGALVL